MMIVTQPFMEGLLPSSK